MPRPTNKTDLLAAIDQERGALETFLETLTPEQMVATRVVGEWSVKDVLAHLIEWEQMLLGCVVHPLFTGRDYLWRIVSGSSVECENLPNVNIPCIAK